MAVRTTVDLPDHLHARLRNRAEKSGTSIRSLIVGAIEQIYPDTNKGGLFLTQPLIEGTGKLGPAFPKDENTHSVVFPDQGIAFPQVKTGDGDYFIALMNIR